MTEVTVGGLWPDPKTGSHVLLLRLPDSPKCLPIWIGMNEASAIAMALRGQEFERPLTHDLLMHVVGGLGAKLSRVLITSIEDNTFYARVFLTRGHDIVSIDARPSDSVALAVRAGCPILLSDELLEDQRDHLVELQAEASEPEGEDPHASSEQALEALLREVERGRSGGDSGPGKPGGQGDS